MADADSRFIDILYSCDADKYWPSKILSEASHAFLILWQLFLEPPREDNPIKLEITAKNTRDPLLLFAEYANSLKMPDGEYDPSVFEKFRLLKTVAAECIRIDQYATRGLHMLGDIADGEWVNYCTILKASAARLIDFEHQKNPEHLMIRKPSEPENNKLAWLRSLEPSKDIKHDGRKSLEHLKKSPGEVLIVELIQACGKRPSTFEITPEKWLDNLIVRYGPRYKKIGLELIREGDKAVARHLPPESPSETLGNT